MFPVLWFGVLAFVFLAGVVAMALGRQTPPIQVLIVPVIMGAFGYFLMKNLVFDLADEVWDAGPELVVRNKGHEVRVALGEVVNVSYTVVTSPQRVTLTLRQPTALGTEISFAAPTTWIPFAKSPVIEELVQRIDAARRLRA